MSESPTDPITPLARELMHPNPAGYQQLVVPDRTPTAATELLGSITADQLVTNPAASRVLGAAMLAGLWLWHDGLAQCHRIAQKSPEELNRSSESSRRSLEMFGERNPSASPGPASLDLSATLAFWHAIMHRREGDFSNSKYWYARCDGHPAFASIAATAGPIVNRCAADKRLLRLIVRGWDPRAMVDLVEQLHDEPQNPLYAVAVELQQIEWRMLMETCAAAATV